MNDKEVESVQAAQSLVIMHLQEDAWRYRIEAAEAREAAATATAREAAGRVDIIKMQYQLWRWRSEHRDGWEELGGQDTTDNESGPSDPGTSQGGPLPTLADTLPEFPTEEHLAGHDDRPVEPTAPAGMKDNDLTTDGLLFTDTSNMTISARFAIFEQYAAQYTKASASALGRALNISEGTIRNYRAFMKAGNKPTGRIYTRKKPRLAVTPRAGVPTNGLPSRSLLGLPRAEKIAWVRKYRATFPTANQRSIAKATKLDEGTLSKIWKNATPAKDERPDPVLTGGKGVLPPYQVVGGLVEFNQPAAIGG